MQSSLGRPLCGWMLSKNEGSKCNWPAAYIWKGAPLCEYHAQQWIGWLIVGEVYDPEEFERWTTDGCHGCPD